MTLVLATGGLGFIGSHTCVCLIENGFDVLILDSLINSSEKTLSKIKDIVSKNIYSKNGRIYFLKCNLINENLLDEVFLEYYSRNNPISLRFSIIGPSYISNNIAKYEILKFFLKVF